MRDEQTILIVDDDESIRRLLSRILQVNGYSPVVAETGKAGMERAVEEKPAVALIDLELGDTSGVDVLREVKGFSPRTECILMTGHATEESAIQAVNLGAYGYLKKPLEEGQLLIMIQRAIEKRGAEEALRRARDELEIRVRERTSELAAANETLSLEVARRKRIEAALEEERAMLAERVAERTAELSAANRELARSSRLKDEFLASMSHELRTPLNAILGMSEALQEEVFGACNEKQHRALKRIEEGGRHLLALITDILDLSKIGAGKIELEMGVVSVESFCHSALGFIKAEAQKKELTISSSFDSSVGTIRADERRLKQVLVNLLSNAMKFTPEGGSIGLEVRGDADQEAVYFTVRDTGIGIAAEDMESLFKPFVQLDGKLAREYEGTGLGLALAHRLAEIHGGSISVESEVGRGSRFTLSLPWGGGDREAEEEKVFEAEQREDEGTEKVSKKSGVIVLLADDQEETINTISDYLEVKGYRMVIARDGAEAVARALEERPDVILMDIQMPGMDGLEATRRIRENDDLASTPIIALTALAMPGDRERCLEAGADEYLSKPVSLKGLVAIIEKLVERESSI